MKALIFVPGIMGTELFLGDEKLWPPKPLETQFGYKRIDKLLEKNLRVGKIIDKVLCIGFYDEILDQIARLGYTEGSAEKRVYPFAYDWRLDLEKTAEMLASRIASAHADGASEIVIAAHSMGGLVSRLVLENTRYRHEPWFDKIKSFVALATPHRGAPLALARVLGLDTALGINKADFKRIASSRDFPSGYQLLPAPGEDCCWDLSTAGVHAVDIYEPQVAQKLGLDDWLLGRVRFMHDTFKAAGRPQGVRYFSFAGTGHETVTRVNIFERNQKFDTEDMVVTRTRDAGDGTVPFWSSLLPETQRHVAVNEHITVFTGEPFKRVFFRLFGVDIGMPLEALGGALAQEAAAPRLSIPTQVIEEGYSFEMVLLFGSPVSELDGRLTLAKLDDDGQSDAPPQTLNDLRYQGPNILQLRFDLPGIAAPGFYELCFECGQDAATIRFAVAQTS